MTVLGSIIVDNDPFISTGTIANLL
jgi:hypothetical protein